MSTVNNAKILRSFPISCRFCFDSKDEHLLIQNGSTLCLVTLKTNTMTEIFTNDGCQIDAFAFSFDGYRVYASAKHCSNSSKVY